MLIERLTGGEINDLKQFELDLPLAAVVWGFKALTGQQTPFDFSNKG